MKRQYKKHQLTEMDKAMNKLIGGRITEARYNRIKIINAGDPELPTRAFEKKVFCTQTELAKALDVKYQQVSKYEQGKNTISSVRLIQIAEFFKRPLDYFTKEATELLRQDTSLTNNPIAPSLKEYGITEKSKCH
jgi:DNA-binding XRE family transcriptional regulator